MMRIAIMGATSQIAKDLILSFSVQSSHTLFLFARKPELVEEWMAKSGIANRHSAANFDKFDANTVFDVIINFVGVGNPAQAKEMGASILDVTLKYDQIALNYVRAHPGCRYLFLSSGAAYGSDFNVPATQSSRSVVPINNLQSQDWYGVAKLYAECSHRAISYLPIIDIRVFSYFSKSQDRLASFLICDILRAIENNSVLKTSAVDIVRDYLHPGDFYRLVDSLLSSAPTNTVVDCYSLSPVSKFELLDEMKKRFGLRYEVVQSLTGLNATGIKPQYFSENYRAAEFGYFPQKSSLSCITETVSEMLSVKEF